MAKVPVLVAVGIVLQHGRVFLTKRADDVHQGGKWEFPGGKVEPKESVTEALLRELKEEIGIVVLASEPFMTFEYDYPEKLVELTFFLVTDFEGIPSGCEGQLSCWFELNQLLALELPTANGAAVDKLLQLSMNIDA